jgi:hypothetical protein
MDDEVPATSIHESTPFLDLLPKEEQNKDDKQTVLGILFTKVKRLSRNWNDVVLIIRL